MPQMAPMYWLFLFFYFLAIFLVYIMLTYYFALPLVKSGSDNQIINCESLNWSW
uniref:ATP synthase complex subunit 8 n=1 Tax=Cloeon dipterum TaxID=197152 RepID=A0A6C0R2Y9_9INSE|nr:ATP synthase F0 subunit 8 [Cloeon dipterum]